MFEQILTVARAFVFGPFLALGFLAGAFVFWKKGGDEYYDQSALMDALVGAAFWGVIAARLGFVATHYAFFGLDVLKWFSIVTYPGYLGIAGLLGGFVAMAFHAKRQRWDLFEILDFAALGVSCAALFVFAGMFLNGSGFGNTTTLPVGLSFPGVFDRRHPTQIYAFVLYLILFVILWKLEGVYRTFLWYRSNKRTAQSGFLISIFLMGYGVIGLLLAFFQPSFIQIFGIHVEAVLRGCFILFGAVLLWKRSGR